VPFCTSTVATGPRPRSKFRFEHHTCGSAFRGRLQLLQVGHQDNHFHQQVQIRFLFCGDVDEYRLAAPLLGHQAAIGELLLDAIRQRIGLVDLVDCNDDRHFSSMRVIDGFDESAA
jgi:hypothetical protein